MAGIDQLLFAGLNHLLRNEAWATERLRPFSGAHVLIEASPFKLNLLIDEQGFFSAAAQDQAVDVTLTLPADAPLRFLLDRNSLFSSVKLAGAADIAESLAFVFRNLRWDIEGDLAGVVGDIPARRISLLGARLGNELQESARRLGENFVEYATEDSSLLAPGRDIDSFGRAVDTLRDDLARLEQRIKRL